MVNVQNLVMFTAIYFHCAHFSTTVNPLDVSVPQDHTSCKLTHYWKGPHYLWSGGTRKRPL